MMEINNVIVEHHFQRLEMKGFFSFTLKKISFVKMWLNNIAILEHRNPRMIMKMISWFKPISSNSVYLGILIRGNECITWYTMIADSEARKHLNNVPTIK